MMIIKKKYIIFLIIALLSIWILGIFLDSRKGAEIRNEYILVRNDDDIKLVVQKLKKIKGGCFISNNNTSIRLLSSQNYNYEDEYIHNNLFVGDSISKNAMSDTIYIFSKKGSMKYFVHGKVINQVKHNK